MRFLGLLLLIPLATQAAPIDIVREAGRTPTEVARNFHARMEANLAANPTRFTELTLEERKAFANLDHKYNRSFRGAPSKADTAVMLALELRTDPREKLDPATVIAVVSVAQTVWEGVANAYGVSAWDSFAWAISLIAKGPYDTGEGDGFGNTIDPEANTGLGPSGADVSAWEDLGGGGSGYADIQPY